MPLVRVTFTILLVSLFALSLSACSGTHIGVKAAENYNSQPLKVYIPSEVDQASAMRAAEAALVGRSWEVVDRGDGQTTGHLKHQRFDATVNIRIESGNLVLYSDSTYTDPQTNEVTPAVPYGWLQNLQKDIQRLIVYESQ
jgi:hypothetical protein